jgi:hypothetical protein
MIKFNANVFVLTDCKHGHQPQADRSEWHPVHAGGPQNVGEVPHHVQPRIEKGMLFLRILNNNETIICYNVHIGRTNLSRSCIYDNEAEQQSCEAS